MPDIVSVNPARPAEVVASYPSGTAHDVDAAVVLATDAQREWVRVTVPARAEIIARVGDVLAERKTELATLVSREAGKILAEAAGDVQEAIDMAYFVAGQGRAAWGETVPCEMPDKFAFTTRQPVGIVGMITPWNFPVAIPSWKILPALLAGNGVVIKPSEHAPACCEAFVAACRDAGVPDGLVQVVHGLAEPAAALTAHPGVRAISFTGSVPTGRKVAAAAMEHGPKLVSLELGGKNAMIVMEDADLDLAVDAIIAARHTNAGQVCTSAERVLVHRDVLEAFTEQYVAAVEALTVGDPMDDVDMGPLASAAQLAKTQAALAGALADGARVVGQGRVDADGGYWHAPAVLRDVQPRMAIMVEETFGPITPIVGVDSLDEALAQANDSRYGLSAYLFSRDYPTIMRAVDELDSGEIYINRTLGESVHAHHTGYKESGIGGEDGKWGLLRYTQVKTAYHHHG
jgi:aldehyde dehydrogenase (NAD+)